MSYYGCLGLLILLIIIVIIVVIVAPHGHSDNLMTWAHDFAIADEVTDGLALATDELSGDYDRRQEDAQTTTLPPSVAPAAVSGLKTLTTTLPEAETHIAANPNPAVLGQQWVGAVSDFSLRGGYNTTKYAYSRNKGSSWVQSFVPLDTVTNKPKTSDSLIWEANSDPVVAFSPTSNKVYLTSLYFNGSDSANGLYVAAATLPTSGSIFTSYTQVYPVKVNSSPSATDFEDKPWITVDPTSGAVYIVWTHFTASSDAIYFSKSTDEGQTWSTPIQVSPSAFNGAVQGPQVAADGHGKVYISWTTFYVSGIRRIHGSKSTDNGASFTSSISAISPYFYGINFPSTYRKESFCAMAVDKVSKTLHVSFAAQASNGTAKVVYSRNVGGTWPSTSFTSPTVLINTSTGQQFFPALAVDPAISNRVQVSWFDTRNNRSDPRRLDIYTTRSTNNGASFVSNVRVTPTSTFVGNTGFVGDYMGVAMQSGSAMPCFAFFVTSMKTAIVN